MSNRSSMIFGAVGLLLFIAAVLILIVAVGRIDPGLANSIPLPRTSSAPVYQFASSVFYDGTEVNVPAIVETDGSVVRLARVLADDPEDTSTYWSSPAWSPNGVDLAYTGQDGQLYMVRLDGREPDPRGVRVSDGRDLLFTHAAIAPGGDRIAYVVQNTTDAGDIAVSATDGSGEILVTQTPHIQEQDIAWSPDGTMLAFTAFVDDRPQVYTVAATGGTPMLLSDHPRHERYAPVWSYDGERVYFAMKPSDGAVAYIQSLPASGGEPTTHIQIVPDTAGAEAFLDSFALIDRAVIAYIRTQTIYDSPESLPTYITTLHIHDLERGTTASPAWNGELPVMLMSIEWRPIVP